MNSNDLSPGSLTTSGLLENSPGELQENLACRVFKLVKPKEHGSWSLALEPLVFGLLAAPSAAGGALALACVAGFFLRRPVKLVLCRKPDPRRALAFSCLVIFGLVALAGLVLAARFEGPEKLWPLLPAALAGGIFVWFDSQNEARENAAELAGVVTFGILPAAFGALAGWTAVEAVALALVMLARSMPTVLFARTYMRRRKGQLVSRAPALLAAVGALLLTVGLVGWRFAPWPALAFVVLMAVRAGWLLTTRRKYAPKTIGYSELVMGLAMVLTVALTWSRH